MIFRTKPSGAPRGAIRPAPLPNLASAFATRRAIFGPHELREDRIRPGSRLAADLAPAARRDSRNSLPQSASISTGFLPVQQGTYNRTLSFVAAAPGIVTAIGTFFPGNAASPANSSGISVTATTTISCAPSGATSGSLTGVSSYTILTQASCVVARGDTVTISTTVVMPTTSSAFSASQLGLSYTYLPQARA